MASADNDYRKFLQLVLKRRFLFTAVAAAACTVGIAVAYLLPKKYEAKSTVFIEKSVINALTEGMAVTQSIEDRVKVLTYALSSRTLLQKVAQDLDVDLVGKDQADLIEKFQKNTEITVKEKDLFTLTYRDENPRLARDYVNTLIQKYIEENLSASRQEYYGANRFLKEQVEHFRTKLQEAEAKLSEFKQTQHYLVSADESLLLGEIKADQKALEELQIGKNQLLAKRQVLARGTIPGGTAVEHLTTLQRKRDQLLLTYTEGYPEVRLVDAEIAQVKRAMRQGRVASDTPVQDGSLEGTLVAIELQSAQHRENQLRRSLEEKKGVLASLPDKRKTLNQLERDRNAYKETHDQLVSRYGRSEVSKQMEIQDKGGTFRIVDPAILPRKPVNPNRIPLILFSVVAGAGLGFALVYLMDTFDNSLKGVDDLQSIGLPVLALIPRLTTLDEQMQERKRSVALTAFVAVYLVGVALLLIVEILQMTGVSGSANLQTHLFLPRQVANAGSHPA